MNFITDTASGLRHPAGGNISGIVDVLLSRLHGVKSTGKDRWIARCPAHDDKSPSMTIRQLDDGRILIHDFAGCDPAAIVGAVGLSLYDLFPPKPERFQAERAAFNAMDVLKAVRFEITVVCIAARQILIGAPISDEDMQRVLLAYSRICEAVRLAGGR